MEDKKVITLLCERAADLNNLLDADGKLQGVSGMSVVKLPCSGMIQPLMIEGALKAGAAGVLVCGCQLGDCFYREGNKLIRERLLGERVPTLKKATDRRRIRALWLSRLQVNKFISDANEFVAYVHGLEEPKAEAAKPAPAARAAAADKPATADKAAAAADKPAADKPADKPATEDKPAEKAKSDAAEKPAEKKAEAKAEDKAEKPAEKSKESAEDKPKDDTTGGDATKSGDK